MLHLFNCIMPHMYVVNTIIAIHISVCMFITHVLLFVYVTGFAKRGRLHTILKYSIQYISRMIGATCMCFSTNL